MKTAVLATAAVFYVPFVADWCEPGLGLRQAAVALDGLPGDAHPFLWSQVVALVGRNVAALGTVSMVAAFLCAVLIAFLAGDVFSLALRAFRRRVTMTDETANSIRRRVELLAALAFVATPGFFHAATRVGPLHFLLLPLLAGLVLLMRIPATVEESLFERVKKGIVQIGLGLALVGGAWFEMELSQALLRTERLSFAVFGVLGVFPLLVLTNLTRRRRLLTMEAFHRFFLGWGFLVAVAAAVSLATVGRGRVASRVVQRIIDSGETCSAVVSDGPLDPLFFFMLPEGRRLLLHSRDGDAAYARDLSVWVGERFADRPELVFAAKLGPRAFVDEWRKSANRPDAAFGILLPENYFPTPGKWREGVAELDGMGRREPLAAFLRNLLAEGGNRLADRFLAAKDVAGAWKLSWEIVASVDAQNRVALSRLWELLDHGYEATPEERDRLLRLREECGAMGVVRANGRASGIVPSAADKVSNELPSDVQALLRLVSVEPTSRNDALLMRETIRRNLAYGRVKLDLVGTRLLDLDRRLDDWQSVERDAVDILRTERGHAAANAVMGKLSLNRHDYRMAEYHLQLALSGGPDERERGTIAKDLAFARAQRAGVRPEGSADAIAPSAPDREEGGSSLRRDGDSRVRGRTAFGGLAGRVVLSLLLIAATFAVETSIIRTRSRRTREQHRIVSECRARMEKALRAAERQRTAAPEHSEPAQKTAPSYRPYRALTPEEKEAKKDWLRARLMKHPKIPDWRRDEEYLTLVLDAARGGCPEAMNKLGEYAFRRKAYVEAYYWALKLEMADLRVTGRSAAVILRHWLRHRTGSGHHGFHSGFHDEQYRFARAVMRIRSGVDREKGLMRLRLLVEEEFGDAELFVEKNGLEAEVGLSTDAPPAAKPA